ncbi:MAG: tetratricopeptide repeat protein [Zoogloeaceae bacterium]|nr:tetratricopeptide repeat protein [Zoogloeaceae bacterium]
MSFPIRPFRSSVARPFFVAFVLAALAFLCAAPVFAATLPEIQRLVKQGQYPQALAQADAYLATSPRDAQGRFLKGLILTEMNRGDDAIIIFTQLTRDYPELPEPYNNLAVLYAQQKQYDKARAALEMAIRTHPAYAIAHENLGDVYAKLASQAYDKALQLDSANAAAQKKLALIRDLSGISGVRNQGSGISVPPQAPPVRAQVPAAAPAKAPPAKEPEAKSVTAPASVPAANVVAKAPPAREAEAKSVTVPARVPTASVVAKVPPPAKEAETTAAVAPEEEILRTLADWAAAWSRQDVAAYLGFYAPEFQPAKGMRRSAWEAERRERILRPEWIKVRYDPPEIRVSGNTANVRFRQHYRASGFSASSRKTLSLVRSGKLWRIVAEEAR